MGIFMGYVSFREFFEGPNPFGFSQEWSDNNDRRWEKVNIQQAILHGGKMWKAVTKTGDINKQESI